jgi:hypothetical protein
MCASRRPKIAVSRGLLLTTTGRSEFASEGGQVASPSRVLHSREGGSARLAYMDAHSQPAFGCYVPDAHAAIARPYGLIVLTLESDAIAAITWFADTGVFRHFGLPRTLPSL